MLLIAALAVLSLTATTALTGTQTATAAEGITYYDAYGNLQTVPEGKTVTVLNQSSFEKIEDSYYIWDKENEGWWFLVEDKIVLDGELILAGDINIIFSDNSRLQPHRGTTITKGSNLALYPQSADGGGSRLTSMTGTPLTMKEGTSLINAIIISGSGGYNGAINCIGNISYIVNGKNATISGNNSGIKLNNNGEIHNYGNIHGLYLINNSSGIWSESGGTIINYSSGVISGHTYGVCLKAGGQLDNYGTIRTSAAEDKFGLYGVFVYNTGKVINWESGLIQSIGEGVRFHEGSKLDNYGTIVGDKHSLSAYNEDGSLTLFNTGTLAGAVDLGNGAHSVTFTVGSVIDGAFDIGNNQNSALNFVGVLDDPLTVATINGKVNIGNVMNDIGGLVLPSGMKPGDKIILIDGSTVAIDGSPANDTFTMDKYDFELKVEETQLIALLSSLDPDITDPEITDPEITDPDITDPEITDPEITDPDITDPEITDPEITDPDITDPDITDPEITDPEITDPEIVNPEKPGPGTPIKIYYVTANADLGAKISPAGKTSAGAGSNLTFAFSAVDGYLISAVRVDGTYLSRAEIDHGYYTFSNLNMNHTIEVISEALSIFLTINVNSGKGHAEYSVNGGSFMKYSSAVALPLHADITVRAVANRDYRFDKWETPAVKTAAEISFGDNMSSLHLELYFAADGYSVSGSGADGSDENRTGDAVKNDILWFATWFILLLLVVALLMLLFFFRRNYNIIKADLTDSIIGKDRVRRKHEYSFTINGGQSGTVSYRIGNSGEWKDLYPNADGKYVIPKGEIINDVMIRHR